MTLHTNVITRLAVLLLLLGVVTAISTPQVWAHHVEGVTHPLTGPGSSVLFATLSDPLQTAIVARGVFHRIISSSTRICLTYQKNWIYRRPELPPLPVWIPHLT